ncbi:hypothetical protein FRC02_004713 [Tulasnella sp. 418]|nr:hypothetical protein FRC02_004713 [Tulasnella sp. 418]
MALSGEVSIFANHKFPQVDLVYPPEHGASIVHVTPLDAPFQLNLVSGASAEGSITVHLIPRIECSISLLGGVAIANVFVQVDVSPRLRGDIRASKFYSTTSDAVNALNGCLDLTNSIHVSAGAEGTLLPLDTVNTVYNLFEKEDHLWKVRVSQIANKWGASNPAHCRNASDM